MSRVRPLSADVASQIKSSSVINSLDDVVIGLVRNALDSEASKIEVNVDFTKGGCTVEDNGCGMLIVDLEEASALETQHWLSRSQRADRHSKTHHFLFSIAALARIQITSRQISHQLPSTIVLSSFDTSPRFLTRNSSLGLLLGENGTRVAVQDLFWNMPVRMRQRTLSEDSAQQLKDFEKLRHELLALLLARQVNVSLSLRDEYNGTRANFQCRDVDPEDLTATTPSASKKATFSIDRSLRLLRQADIISDQANDSWISVSGKSEFVSVRGAICLDPAPTKNCQFISVGVRPIRGCDIGRLLYQRVNTLFSSSYFGAIDDVQDVSEEDNRRRQNDKRFKHDGPTIRQLKHRQKGTDRWPSFCLQVQVHDRVHPPDPDYDDDSDLDAIFQSMTTVIESVVTEWLFKYHFILTPTRNGRSDVTRPSTSSESLPKEELSLPDFRIDSAETGRASDSRNDFMISFAAGPYEEPMKAGNDLYVPWKHPTTKEIRHINTRSGMLIQSLKHEQSSSRRPSTAPAGDSSLQRSSHVMETGTKKVHQDGIVSRVLRSWKNPIFENVEQLIQRVSNESFASTAGSIAMRTRMEVLLSSCRLSNPRDHNTSSSASLSGAKFISHLDGKFILLKIPIHSASTSQARQQGPPQNCEVVLVDQHAADERIKFEQLLEDLCSPVSPGRHPFRTALGHTSRIQTVRIDKALDIAVSQREADILSRHAGHFANWGVLYDLNPPRGVTVHTLPPSIAARCTAEPRLIRDILRSEAWILADPARPHRRAPPTEKIHELGWLKRIGTCPQGILDMLASRACRSAVMFNDALTSAQCEALVRNLAACEFPLICAHGRPSAVRIVRLEERSGSIFGGAKSGRAVEDSDMGFLEAYKLWRCRG